MTQPFSEPHVTTRFTAMKRPPTAAEPTSSLAVAYADSTAASVGKPCVARVARVLARWVPATILAAVMATTLSAEEEKSVASSTQVLIDVDRNIRIDNWKTGSEDWTVTKDVLRGGRQEGVDRIVVDNGVLSFTIIPTRGMDIWDARCGDVRLGWDSPVKEVVHPQFVNLSDRGGLGWLEGFGAWMCRCGLASNGAPGVDNVVTNTGSIAPVQLGLHGKISYVPARHVSVAVGPGEKPEIKVTGVVDETMMYGTQLRMTTEITTTIGSKSLTIRDTITNLGASRQEFELLYHANYGPTILEGGAEVVAPAVRVTPRDPRAAEGGMRSWHLYDPPTPGYVEQVYFLALKGNDLGETEVLLKNAAGSRGASIRFSLHELPHLTIWKNTAATGDGYVTGIEPATNFPNNRQFERENGRVPTLEGGASFTASLTFSVHTSDDEVAERERRVRALLGGDKTQLDLQPVPGLCP